MTPVQLPEVPASLDTVCGMVRGERDWVEPCDDYYTADQLREYATEAVMAERARLDWLVEQLRGADLYAALYPHYAIGGDIRAAIDAHTQPEQNSDP